MLRGVPGFECSERPHRTNAGCQVGRPTRSSQSKAPGCPPKSPEYNGIKTFTEWLAGLKGFYARKNIKVSEDPDGTLHIKKVSETRTITVQEQQEEHNLYLDRKFSELEETQT